MSRYLCLYFHQVAWVSLARFMCSELRMVPSQPRRRRGGKLLERERVDLEISRLGNSEPKCQKSASRILTSDCQAMSMARRVFKLHQHHQQVACHARRIHSLPGCFS